LQESRESHVMEYNVHELYIRLIAWDESLSRNVHQVSRQALGARSAVPRFDGTPLVASLLGGSRRRAPCSGSLRLPAYPDCAFLSVMYC